MPSTSLHFILKPRIVVCPSDPDSQGLAYHRYIDLWFSPLGRLAYQSYDWNPNAAVSLSPGTAFHSDGDPDLECFRCHSRDL